MKLPTRIFLGLLAGAAAGIASRATGAQWLQKALIFIEPAGTIFVQLIMMVLIPLVVASMFVAMASLGDSRSLTRIGGRTLAYFLSTTLIGSIIGLTVALAVRPGSGLDPAVRDALVAQGQRSLSQTAAANSAPGLLSLLTSVIPQNPVGAAARMEILPLVIAVVIFGAAANKIAESRRQVLVGFFRGLSDTCMVVIRWIMKLAPYAVFALIGATVAKFGLELLRQLIVYCLAVVAGLLLHALVILTPAVFLLARMKVRHFYQGVSKALLLAFSTASSNAALPVSLQVAEDNLGVPPEIAGFVLPLGTSLNLNGAAVYKSITGMFVAQVYGITLGPAGYVTVVVAATLAAVTGVGVPGSSLVTTLIVLNAIGLGPHAVSGIALVFGVDRMLDMLRTTVNVTSSLTCAAYVARMERDAGAESKSRSAVGR